MLKHLLIHPRINEILGRAGHHATILIADGHFPASTKKGPNAEVVCLNLMPGVVTCAQALEAVLTDDRRRASMAAAAKDASRRFALPAIAGQYDSWFSELVA